MSTQLKKNYNLRQRSESTPRTGRELRVMEERVEWIDPPLKQAERRSRDKRKLPISEQEQHPALSEAFSKKVKRLMKDFTKELQSDTEKYKTVPPEYVHQLKELTENIQQEAIEYEQNLTKVKKNPLEENLERLLELEEARQEERGRERREAAEREHRCEELLRRLEEKEEKLQVTMQAMEKIMELDKHERNREEDRRIAAEKDKRLDKILEMVERRDRQPQEACQDAQNVPCDKQLEEVEQGKRQPLFSEVAQAPPRHHKRHHQLEAAPQVNQEKEGAIVIVDDVNPRTKSKDLMLKFRREVMKKDIELNVEAIKGTDRNRIIIETSTREKARELTEKLNEELPREDMTYTLPKVKRNRVLLLDVPNDISDTQLLEKLQDMTANEKELFSIQHRIKKKNETVNIVIEATPSLTHYLLKKGRILLDLISARIVPYVRIMRCQRCQEFGHSRQQCRGRKACEHCAGDHNIEDCARTKERPRCGNCRRRGEEEYHHKASSPACNTFKQYKEEQLRHLYRPSR